MRREVERAGLVGLDGAIRMRGDPGSLLCMSKSTDRSMTFATHRSCKEKYKKLCEITFRAKTFTGLFCDRTPTAGSQGRFRSSDKASALGAPVFEDGSSILSISEGSFPDKHRIKTNKTPKPFNAQLYLLSF